MTMRYIVGDFTIVGASPDGDSVRFSPYDPTAFIKAGIDVDMNGSGSVQLRLDAIDALETHYTPPGGSLWRQPTALGDGASAALLALLGFHQVSRDVHGSVVAARPTTTDGYILTRFADEYGRAVATAYSGRRAQRDLDGALVYLDVPELLRSVNYQLLAAGWVYPTFYSQLYPDLRDVLALAAAASRASGAGVWDEDATLGGFTLQDRSQLEQQLIILPKLFRRLAEYLTADPTGGVDLSAFLAFLEARKDQLLVPPYSEMTTLDAIVVVDQQNLRMTVPPEDIVFIEA